MNINYGEILFLGECNCKCYYCLANEMKNLKLKKENQLNIHFSKWKNFNEFIKILKDARTQIIYLSSVITDPLLYDYMLDLIIYLKGNGFKVGIRTNGYLFERNILSFKEFDEEISISVNTLNSNTNKKICGVSNILDCDMILSELSKLNKKCRITIVVNRYNCDEIPEMLNYFSKYKNISYVQLRRVYKYYEDFEIDNECYKKTTEWLKSNSTSKPKFHESFVYNYKGIIVSTWSNVFKKSSIVSLNYFTDGFISDDNLLIRAYEGEKNE